MLASRYGHTECVERLLNDGEMEVKRKKETPGTDAVDNTTNNDNAGARKKKLADMKDDLVSCMCVGVRNAC